MICPICGREYGEHYVICTYCEVNLVAEPNESNSLEEDSAVIKGKKLTCPICGGTHFTEKTYALKPGEIRLFESEEEAVAYICNGCGYIFWFTDIPVTFSQKELMDNQGNVIDYETSEATDDECPICFTRIKSGDRECANCGHKFRVGS